MTTLFIIAVLLAGLAFFITTRPDDFRVTRTATFNATPDAVFEQINNLHKWQDWSPWSRMEPHAKTWFSGPDAGVGAAFRWMGQKTGQGTMTITDSEPFDLVHMRLEFVKPMVATNITEFKLQSADGAQTTLTWSMSGKNNFMAKAIGLVMNCEKMVGGQFNDGLNNLREIVER